MTLLIEGPYCLYTIIFSKNAWFQHSKEICKSPDTMDLVPVVLVQTSVASSLDLHKRPEIESKCYNFIPDRVYCGSLHIYKMSLCESGLYHLYMATIFDDGIYRWDYNFFWKKYDMSDHGTQMYKYLML